MKTGFVFDGFNWYRPLLPNAKYPTTTERRLYSAKRRAFLKANPWCEVTLKRTGEYVKATHVHHKLGRKGDYYLNDAHWVACTKAADKWIHDNPDEARRLGFL